MTCIVINNDRFARNAFHLLIDETDDLILLASFCNIFEASRFMSDHIVDLIIISVKIAETRSFEFIMAISNQIFVIFISEFSSIAIGELHNTDAIGRSKSVRFKTGIELARNYNKAERNHFKYQVRSFVI